MIAENTIVVRSQIQAAADWANSANELGACTIQNPTNSTTTPRMSAFTPDSYRRWADVCGRRAVSQMMAR